MTETAVAKMVWAVPEDISADFHRCPHCGAFLPRKGLPVRSVCWDNWEFSFHCSRCGKDVVIAYGVD